MDEQTYLKPITYRIQALGATRVLYVDTGGRPLGEAIGAAAGLPCTPVDVRYPMSRLMDAAPGFLRPVLWLFKEIVYKATRPTAGGVLSGIEGPVVLVDDRASSGKTLKVVLGMLDGVGVPREDVLVVVGKCGVGAGDMVDMVVDRRI